MNCKICIDTMEQHKTQILRCIQGKDDLRMRSSLLAIMSRLPQLLIKKQQTRFEHEIHIPQAELSRRVNRMQPAMNA
jgi:hypothetical protein